MPSNTFPTSTLQLGSLQEPDTPALLDLRTIIGMLQGPSGSILRDAFELIQQAIDNLQQTLRSNVPGLKYLQVDAADIAVLAVGGEFGPGEFTVYNGPPDYAPIGWIGSRAKTTTVNLTSIVAGLVTSAAPHLLKVGDNVYIEATTDPLNAGFYVVATRPLATTFTVVGGVASGNSTGGTMTKQFQGLWVKMGAIGGTAFDNAPFQVDVDGAASITNATITLTGTNGSIVLDPTMNPPELIFTDALTGNTIRIVAGVGIVQASAGGADPSLITGISDFILKNVTHQTVVRIRCDVGVTEAGMMSLTNSNGTKSILLDPSAATAISVVGGGDIDVSGVYKVNGVPVAGMGPPEPDPGTVATSPSISTGNTASIAGATYTATEQGMLNILKSAVADLNTDVANLKTQVDNLITDRNNLRSVLQAFGVMA